MRKKAKMSGVILSLLLIAAMILQMPLFAFADESSKAVMKSEKSYEIALVFDNSGSMYRNEGWCRAKYAMEIFASMLNYERDVLKIFPMWEVTTDGSTPDDGGSASPIEIRSKEDIDKISRIYTPRPDNTPLAPIAEAHDALVASSAQVKWLIVLADGGFNLDERQREVVNAQNKSEKETKTYLESMCTNGIQVQYLGIGNAMGIAPNEGIGFHSKKSPNDKTLKEDLVKICNDIFQRDELSSKYIKGNKVKLDLSMKNIIVFAQGNGAVINGLKDASGKPVGKTLDSGQRKYSEISCGGDYTHPVDTTLAGQVVNFDACPKGEYTLDATGAEKIQIFYEPDVEITCTMINEDGQPVDYTKNEITAGTYTMEYGLVDSVTKEDATKSELLGKVDLVGVVERADGSSQEFRSGEQIVLTEDSETNIVIEGSYLEKYKITTRDNPNFSFLKFSVSLPDAGDIKINAYTNQSSGWYKLSDHENWKSIRADVTLNGAPLTPEQMQTLEMSMEFSKDIPYTYKMLPNESAYEIYIGSDESGNYIAPKQGNYTLRLNAKLADEHGRTSEDNAKVKFEVRPYDKIWEWLMWLIVLGILLLVIIFIMTRKAWPKEMYLDCNGGLNDIDVDEEINLASNAFPGVLPCSAKKASMLYQRGGKSAAVKIVDVSPMYSVTSFKIGASKRYQKDSTGRFVDNSGKEFTETVVRHGTTIQITRTRGSAIVGKINMNG